MDEAVYGRGNGRYYITTPLLRSEEDREALWEGIKEGAIQVVATDHCPFTRYQKDSGKNVLFRTPNGLPGVEILLPIMYSEGAIKRGLSPNELVALLAYNPARIFGLYPGKGVIEEGSDADLVIFNPEKEVKIQTSELHMNLDYSPYEGLTLKGIPDITISRGEIIYERGNFPASPVRGEFIQAISTQWGGC